MDHHAEQHSEVIFIGRSFVVSSRCLNGAVAMNLPLGIAEWRALDVNGVAVVAEAVRTVVERSGSP